MWFYPCQTKHYHTSLNVFNHIMLDYSLASGNLTDVNIKSLCCLLLIFETRIAITITRNRHQHHDCEDITMFDIIKIITQLYSGVDKIQTNKHTNKHTNVTDKCNYKKPDLCQLMADACLV